MINIKLILIFISVLFLHSCDENSNELSGGYCISSDGSWSVLPASTVFEKEIYGQVIDFEFDDKFIILVQKPDLDYHIRMVSFYTGLRYRILKTLNQDNEELLPGQYEYYKQKLIEDSSLYKLMNELGVSTENTVKDIITCDKLAVDIINNDSYYQNIFSREINYWIIAHGEQQKYYYLPSSIIYGPYSKGEYLGKRKELKVPENLKLR